MRNRRWHRLLASGALGCCSPIASDAWASAQQSDERTNRESGGGEAEQIVVTAGLRRSAAGDIAPIATLDSAAVAATGATTIAELLRSIRGVTQSADGSDPIFLLNAQRVSAYQEIGALPPEAIERMEVLPEMVALRFGFPPTRRVLNFITKRRFRQVEFRASAGTATAGGTSTEKANVALTRLRDDSRLTLGFELRHTDPLYRSDRAIAPDPDLTFDAIGNVRGVDGEIDPALSAIAGHIVRIAPVPADPGNRGLAGYAAGADQPRLFDTGRYRTLIPGNEAVKAEAVIADRIGGTLAGSISLSAEQSRDRTLGGPGYASFLVPASNPYSPFARAVLLDRYLTEVAPLRQHQTTTTLHAAFLLRGAIAGWRWDLTAAIDQQRTAGISEVNIDKTAASAAIIAGANPFTPLDPRLLAARRTDHAQVRTRTTGVKAVVTNTPLRIPAGRITVTATGEFDRSTANSAAQGANPSALHLDRGRVEGGLAIDVPLTSRREHVLAAVGDISANASIRMRSVGGFGALNDSTYGASWSPIEGVQLLATVKHSAAAPDLKSQSSPVLQRADIPVFDTRRGRTELVTVISGGNPDLRAERKLVHTLGLTVKPFAKRELRVSATWEATTLRDQIGTVSAITAQTEAALPDLFVRDTTGRLVSAAYRPINFAVEHQQTFNVTLNANGTLGKPAPVPGSGGAARQPAHFYAGFGWNLRLRDRLQLRPGTPELDLLAGDSFNGGNTMRTSGYVYAGINRQDIGVTFNAWAGAGGRVRGLDPSGDLHFSSIESVNLGAYFGVRRIWDRAWTRRLRLQVDLANLTDSHLHVRDANGTIPNRYQPGYTEPVGRTVTVTLRKLF